MMMEKKLFSGQQMNLINSLFPHQQQQLLQKQYMGLSMV